MAENANEQCAICGKDFHMKYHCNKNGNSSPWMAHCDTVEHYKVFQIVNGYTGGVYDIDEAKSKLDAVDTSDKDTYRANIKTIVDKILAGSTPTPKPQHDVTYSFQSGTAEHDALPEGVNQKLPSTTQAAEGETVTPDAIVGTVEEGNGTWAFKEWQPASQQMDTDGIAFVGVWEWTEKPKHAVTYEFASGTVEQHTLPEEVTGKLPSQGEAYEGADVTPTPASFESVSVADGTWTFVSWEPASATMDTDGVNFVGTWTYAATGA